MRVKRSSRSGTNAAALASVLLVVAAFCLSCNSDSGPTTPRQPAAPPKVLPQAPMSCTFRVDGPHFDDRVGWFSYDVRWFPPGQQGADPVTSYEVELGRAAVTGHITSEGYQIQSTRMLPLVKKTVRANTGTTNDLHRIDDIATFPVCEFFAQGEDLTFASQVSARSAAGLSLWTTCVEADRLWDGIVLYIANAPDFWNYYCNNAAGAPPTVRAPDWVKGLPTH